MVLMFQEVHLCAGSDTGYRASGALLLPTQAAHEGRHAHTCTASFAAAARHADTSGATAQACNNQEPKTPEAGTVEAGAEATRAQERGTVINFHKNVDDVFQRQRRCEFI